MTGEDNWFGKRAKWDIPPWEVPGNFRLDAKPHRGPVLRRLANAAFVCAVASYYPFGGFLFCIVDSSVQLLGAAVVLGQFGWVIGMTVWLLARGDLERMRTGEINPEGEGETRFARDRGILSLILGLGSFLLWGTVILLEYLRF